MFDGCLVMPLAFRVPIFFGFSTLRTSSAREIGFKCRIDIEKSLLVIELEENKSKVFSSTFGEEALLLDFEVSISSRSAPSRLEKKQTFEPLSSW